MERGALKWLVSHPFYAAGLAFMRMGRLPPDLDPCFSSIYAACQPFTMTQRERMYALYESVKYVCTAELEGALVECGVWKGGSAMIMALTLAQCGCLSRSLYLYDTFEGMSAPTKRDVDVLGNRADDTMKHYADGNGSSSWCYSSLDEVRKNVDGTGYPPDRISYVKGNVEDTIPATIPEKIALLRLDTDFYESTYHELVHLYPRLVSGGVLILDDYGHWRGFREAVDRYFAENRIALLMNRVDYQGRVAVKP